MGIAVDGQHIYWTNVNNGTIGEANLDGTDVNESIVSGASAGFGIAVSVPIAQVSPATPPAFTTTPQGTLSSPQALTVTNGGQQALSISGLSFTGADPDDFLIGANTCLGPIDPGDSCELQVYFAPEAKGTRSATLQIASNDIANGPLVVALSGTGGSLPTGATGATGATGPAGKPGPAGPAGKVELVTCTKKTGRRKVQSCKAKTVTKPVKFKVGALRATLSRHGVIYASGFARGTRHGLETQLIDLRPLRAGRYTLRIGRTVHETVEIRLASQR